MTKSTHNRIFAGVCGGIADFFGWDARIVRVLLLLTSFFSVGMPILLYAALAFAMPKED
jgi:phage shock protein C